MAPGPVEVVQPEARLLLAAWNAKPDEEQEESRGPQDPAEPRESAVDADARRALGDPLRAGDETSHHPGEAVLRMADVVVIATGYNQAPHIPDWPGLDRYTGTFMHASEYRTGADHRGRAVLVVGSGNTGAEACADLGEQGAGRVISADQRLLHRGVFGLFHKVGH